MGKKVYAIKEGFNFDINEKIENKIVNTWAECLRYVKGVKGAKYKSFEDITEANKFLNDSTNPLKKEDNNYPKDCLHIYVDGSYNAATEEYSYGMVAVESDVVLHIDSGLGKSSSAKNIRQIAGELEAAVRGVQYAINTGKDKVVIFHDYIGICYHATGFWDRKEESSKKYYSKMQNLMSSGIEVIFVKVDSHTGDFFNELADEKCKEKLSIPSDKVVEKWLTKNILKVANEEVKKELAKIVSKGEENIIIVNPNSEKSDYKDIVNNKLENKTEWIDSIKKYNPYNEQEEKDKELILHCTDTFKDILTRDNKLSHITSSAFVVNKKRDKVLMVHHNIYNSWSWTGGHADGEEDLLAVAIREVKEETGVQNISPVTSDIFSLEILPVVGHIKIGEYVSAHLHLSVAYLLEGDDNESLVIKEDENSDVKWIPIDEVNEHSNEPHMQKIYSKLISKIKELRF